MPGKGLKNPANTSLGQTGNTSAVSVGTTATLIHGPNSSRISLTLTNNGPNILYCDGNPSVTTANAAFIVQVNGVLVDDSSIDGWYGITSVSTTDVRVAEVE